MGRPKSEEAKNRPKHMGFRVEERVYEGIKSLADRRGVPMSDLAHEALECFLAKHGVAQKA